MTLFRLLAALLAALALLALPCARAVAAPPGQLLQKPAGLDDAGWDSLQKSIEGSVRRQARLLAGRGEAGDTFGVAIAVAGDTALVGVSRDDVGSNVDQGSVYVYTRVGNGWGQQAQLFANDGATGDLFGASVALSGDTALVGAERADGGAGGDQGAAYVFTRSGVAWTQQAKLVAGDGAPGDAFGSAVAVSGDTALVGADGVDFGSNTTQGAAYVYTRSGTTWSLQSKLVAGDGERNDLFGTAVALSGDTALIGATSLLALDGRGAAYVYVRNATSWAQQAKLEPAQASGQNFGWAVALSGDTALVGFPNANVGATQGLGAAYVYTRSGSTWAKQAELTAADGTAGDLFGISVALSGDTALVGSLSDDVDSRADEGSAYVFVRSGTAWTQQAKLLSRDGAAGDAAGAAVALSIDTALVGVPGDDLGIGGNQGSAQVYERTGASWAQREPLLALDGEADDLFGISVALSRDTALVGMSGDDVGPNANQGSVFVFTRNGKNWERQARLVAADGAPGDGFGASVAVSGDTAFIGAADDDVGPNADQGSVYIYARSGTTWTAQAQLVAADGGPGEGFGRSLSVSGDTLLVGASPPFAGGTGIGGAAYVYTRNGAAWTPQAKLVAGDGSTDTLFGRAVALSGDTALVGAGAATVAGNFARGAAYVYARNGTTWGPQAKLVATDGATFDLFGASVALSGDTALVGAPSADVGANANQGAAYVYTRNGTTWAPQAKLVANDAVPDAQFGRAVALDGNLALIGAPLDTVGSNPEQGSASFYVRAGTAWTRAAKLFAEDGDPIDRYGASTALSVDTAVVGSPADQVGTNIGQGSAYVHVGLEIVFSDGVEPR